MTGREAYPYQNWNRHLSRLWIASIVGLSAGAIFADWLEARLPLGPGNTAVHHGYPFFGMAAILTIVGCRTRRHAPRWSARLRWLATAYAANALLIALLSYAVTPQGPALRVATLGWLADVVFPVCDVAFLGLIVGMPPDARAARGYRRAPRSQPC